MSEYVVLRVKALDGTSNYPFNAFLVKDRSELNERIGKDIDEGDVVIGIATQDIVARIEPPLKVIELEPKL